MDTMDSKASMLMHVEHYAVALKSRKKRAQNWTQVDHDFVENQGTWKKKGQDHRALLSWREFF